MKTLYLDCGMGAAGDMLTAALLELLPDQDGFIEEMNALGIPDVNITKEASVKCGIRGTHISVTVGGIEEVTDIPHEHGHHHEHEHAEDHAHHHSGMHEIAHIIEHLKLSSKVKADVLAVYSLIAEAESKAN